MGEKTDTKVKQFSDMIRNIYSIDRIIFFGSRARGTHTRNSDYDFILVSKDFRGMRFTERISKIYPYWKFNESIEPLCYTPEEFNKLKKQITIVKEAVENGIEI